MLFGSKLLALVAAFSTIAVASSSPDALPAELSRRNDCPRYEAFDGAKAIASLYLGKGNNKSNQVERLIEQAIALLAGPQPICKACDIYVSCQEDGDHWGKRDVEERNNNQCDPYCENLYPYKHCNVKCKNVC
ncbi:MAG: hypothetical protein LQ347_004002 [Umbilicaria vellea]|nr:MAG: hypothetical protein LQ347_004002 [Umbilicaria vellea]